jgi:hypothetical protein
MRPPVCYRAPFRRYVVALVAIAAGNIAMIAGSYWAFRPAYAWFTGSLRTAWRPGDAHHVSATLIAEFAIFVALHGCLVVICIWSARINSRIVTVWARQGLRMADALYWPSPIGGPKAVAWADVREVHVTRRPPFREPTSITVRTTNAAVPLPIWIGRGEEIAAELANRAGLVAVTHAGRVITYGRASGG